MCRPGVKPYCATTVVRWQHICTSSVWPLKLFLCQCRPSTFWELETALILQGLLHVGMLNLLVGALVDVLCCRFQWGSYSQHNGIQRPATAPATPTTHSASANPMYNNSLSEPVHLVTGPLPATFDTWWQRRFYIKTQFLSSDQVTGWFRWLCLPITLLYYWIILVCHLRQYLSLTRAPWAVK